MPPNAQPAYNFTHKYISISVFTPHPDGSSTQFTVGEGHAIRASITHNGGLIGSELEMTLNGLSPHDTNNLALLPDHSFPQNPNIPLAGHSFISVYAGASSQPRTNVFNGIITDAFTDYNLPDLPLQLHALTSTLPATTTPAAKGYYGARTVISLLQDICTEAGFHLVNHGGWDHHNTLTNHYRWGTCLEQIQAILHAVKGVFNFTPAAPLPNGSTTPYKGQLDVWGPHFYSSDSSPPHESAPLISAETGLVGYPQYNSSNLLIRSLLRPDITFWQPIQLKTSTTSPSWNGFWTPAAIRHDISSAMEDGPWHSSLRCIPAYLG